MEFHRLLAHTEVNASSMRIANGAGAPREDWAAGVLANFTNATLAGAFWGDGSVRLDYYYDLQCKEGYRGVL